MTKILKRTKISSSVTSYRIEIDSAEIDCDDSLAERYERNLEQLRIEARNTEEPYASDVMVANWPSFYKNSGSY
jgi:hypothetical protein